MFRHLEEIWRNPNLVLDVFLGAPLLDVGSVHRIAARELSRLGKMKLSTVGIGQQEPEGSALTWRIFIAS